MKKFSILSIIVVCSFLSAPVQAQPSSNSKSLFTFGLGALSLRLVQSEFNGFLYALPYRGVTTPVAFLLPWFVLRAGEMVAQQRSNRS